MFFFCCRSGTPRFSLYSCQRAARLALCTGRVVVKLLVLAVATPFREVRVFGREDLFLLAGIETEDLLLGFGGAGLPACNGLFGVALRVLATAYLYGGAAAVPTIGREVVVPEGVGGWQGNAIEGGVFLTELPQLDLRQHQADHHEYRTLLRTRTPDHHRPEFTKRPPRHLS